MKSSQLSFPRGEKKNYKEMTSERSKKMIDKLDLGSANIMKINDKLAKMCQLIFVFSNDALMRIINYSKRTDEYK